MSSSFHAPELLAPAGSIESLHAAVCGGANAVYLGLNEFNARRNADNFTVETLREACDYAHLRGVRVYVTLNVEILPSELDSALTLAGKALARGADAFIVQDLGLARKIACSFPQAEIHVSTQMNVHNAAGIVAAAQLGAKRITLARELSLAEVAELAAVARDFGMEVECFAHGALCICYSGQCLMSSMIGGRSANRGLCAQACRLAFELHREDRKNALPAEGEHLLSPRDLCTIDLLGDFMRAGVSSLKIEGRMKSASYVREVVSVYREALDGLTTDTSTTKNQSVATTSETSGKPEAFRERLAEAFSRGFTTAYLSGNRGNEMMSYGRPNNRGVFVGRVDRVESGVAQVVPETHLHAGDVVEFWTNRGHFTANVPNDCPSGKQIRIPVEQRVGKGDRVFRVRNAATIFEDDSFEPRIRVDGQVVLKHGMPAYICFTTADGNCGEARGTVVEAARTKPPAESDVRAHVDRLGQTPFTIGELSIDLDEGVGMGFSQLHRLRSEALAELEQNILEPYVRKAETRTKVETRTKAETRTIQSKQPVAKDRGAPHAHNKNASGDLHIMAWASNPGCARAARRAGAHEVYVPLLNFRRGQAQLVGIRQGETEQAGYPKQCVMALPTIDHDPLPGTRENSTSFELWDYVREGKPVFADSLASIVRALEAGALVEAGPHVSATNAASLQYLADLGVKRVWLSPELTLGQVADLTQSSPIDVGLFVCGAQELMICEHCLLMSQGPCNEQCESCLRRSTAHWLVDRKGFEFPVVSDMMGRSHLYNGIELDAVASIPDFLSMGISALMVDTTLMDRKTAESAVKRTLRAVELARKEHRSVEKRPGTTTGHLFRGVL